MSSHRVWTVFVWTVCILKVCFLHVAFLSPSRLVSFWHWGSGLRYPVKGIFLGNSWKLKNCSCNHQTLVTYRCGRQLKTFNYSKRMLCNMAAWYSNIQNLNAKGLLISLAVSCAKYKLRNTPFSFGLHLPLKCTSTENCGRDITDMKQHCLTSLVELDLKFTCK